MNDRISHSVSYLDFTETFPHALAGLRGCVEQDDVAGALAAAKMLQNLFDRLLQMADPHASYQARASLTEIHRLLRILGRDVLFWQGAKQTRADRRNQILATLVSIESFYGVLISHQARE